MRWGIALTLVAVAACNHNRNGQEQGATDLFQELSSSTGLKFQHFTGSTGQFYMPEIMGSGVALIDFDNDGDLDIYLIQGAHFQRAKSAGDLRFPLPAGHPEGNRMFRNDLVPSGKLSFTDVTEQTGTGVNAYGMGVAAGDYDNDGNVDLYLTNFGSNVLLRNNGNGRFTDVTRAAGVDDPRWSTSAAFFDYDRDGDLDLFVAAYVDFTIRGHKECFGPTGEVDYCTPRAYRPTTDRLFRNEGNGKFSDVSISSGVGTVQGPGLGVSTADMNGDGWPDIFVANDAAANFLWVNQRDGTFKESGLQSGAAYSEDGVAKAGMGITAGDFDNDGDEDVFVVNLTREGATLYRNEGGHFADGSMPTKLGPATFPYTGFGTGWFDYNNDGFLDLFVANGAVTIIESQRGRPYPFEERNLLLRNIAGSFEDVSERAGDAFRVAEVSRGAAFGDIDNDGRVDIVVTNNNGPARLLLNQTSSRLGWLSIRLQGTKSNRMALGARIALHRKGAPVLWRRAHTDSSYLSANDPRVHFGLGDADQVERVEVHWPDGSKETWTGVEPRRFTTLVQGTGK